MVKFAPVPWKKFEKFLLEVGCVFVREKGDHRIYTRSGLKRPIVIPRSTAIPMFVMRNNLRLLGMDADSYLEILDRL